MNKEANVSNDIESFMLFVFEFNPLNNIRPKIIINL
jgi:hypothetical protein